MSNYPKYSQNYNINNEKIQLKHIKHLNRHFTKEEMQMADKHEWSILRNCKSKQQDTTNLLEWVNFKMLTTANAEEDVEKQKLSFITDKNAKCYSYFGMKFDSSDKTK